MVELDLEGNELPGDGGAHAMGGEWVGTNGRWVKAPPRRCRVVGVRMRMGRERVSPGPGARSRRRARRARGRRRGSRRGP